MLNLFQYYLFLDFINHFNKSETVKLTVAPRAAKIIVFKTSSENKLGKMLKKVPAAVPVLREILVSITCFVEVLFFLYSPFGG
jgi:hypothetical protein